jgi:hypothetical protein
VLGSDTPPNSRLGAGDQQPEFLGLLWARQEAGTGEADLAGYRASLGRRIRSLMADVTVGCAADSPRLCIWQAI